jgi:uncharacterized protein (DUF433 family)
MTLNNLLETQGIIQCDPEIMSGVPVFAGTRVPLQTFFDYLEGEGGLVEFINDFPYLETQTMTRRCGKLTLSGKTATEILLTELN